MYTHTHIQPVAGGARVAAHVECYGECNVLQCVAVCCRVQLAIARTESTTHIYGALECVAAHTGCVTLW